MKIILLAGQNISNKEWIENVGRKFNEKYLDTEIQYYIHWQNGMQNTNVELETKRFIKTVGELDDEYILFAKSIGSIIFLNSLVNLKKKPKGVLIVGMAYKLAKDMGYDFKKFKNLITFPVKIYQKEFDPAGVYKDIMHIDGEGFTIQKYECVGERNSNHRYENYDYILSLLDELV